jgi:hypothetical protein
MSHRRINRRDKEGSTWVPKKKFLNSRSCSYKAPETQNWKWKIKFAAQNHEDERKAGKQLPQPQRPDLRRRAPTPGFIPGLIHPVSSTRSSPRSDPPSNPPGLLTRALVGAYTTGVCKGGRGNRARAPFSGDAVIASGGPVWSGLG